MNILLIGFMGSGKSTIGKKLARKINYGFIDLDKQIEIEQNLKVEEIFNNKGESYFRKCETNWLKNFKGKNMVIALGGGTPCFNNNITLINKIGVSVYLKMNVGLLTNRLINAKQKRPLIESYKHNSSILEDKISDLMKEREVFYNLSNYKIDASNFDNEKYEMLIEMLNS